MNDNNNFKDETMEEIKTEVEEVKEAVVEETAPVEEPTPVMTSYYQQAATKGKDGSSWWEKAVSRKFLIATLAIAMLLNAALSAGTAALFGRHGIRSKSSASNNQSSKPGYEQFYDNNQNNGSNPSDNWGRGGRGYDGGRMNPPSAPWGNDQNNNQNNNQNAAPDNNQNAAPNTNNNTQDNNTQNNDTKSNNT